MPGQVQSLAGTPPGPSAHSHCPAEEHRGPFGQGGPHGTLSSPLLAASPDARLLRAVAPSGTQVVHNYGAGVAAAGSVWGIGGKRSGKRSRTIPAKMGSAVPPSIPERLVTTTRVAPDSGSCNIQEL